MLLRFCYGTPGTMLAYDPTLVLCVAGTERAYGATSPYDSLHRLQRCGASIYLFDAGKTLDPKPWTLDPGPWTLDPRP
eukprot:1111362-Rhodomonas_salina.1